MTFEDEKPRAEKTADRGEALSLAFFEEIIKTRIQSGNPVNSGAQATDVASKQVTRTKESAPVAARPEWLGDLIQARPENQTIGR